MRIQDRERDGAAARRQAPGQALFPDGPASPPLAADDYQRRPSEHCVDGILRPTAGAEQRHHEAVAVATTRSLT
jgi:hypothetical protein